MYHGKISSFWLFFYFDLNIDNFDILFSYSNKQDRPVGLNDIILKNKNDDLWQTNH